MREAVTHAYSRAARPAPLPSIHASPTPLLVTPATPAVSAHYAPLGQVADGAIVRLTHPTRLGLKESAAPPGYSYILLADGSYEELANETPVAVLPDPIALALIS